MTRRSITVLIAQLATSGGIRAPVAHLANQIFLDLANELEQQGVSRKVSADMFGMALRAYIRKVRRLSETQSERGQTLWQAVLEFVRKEGLVARDRVIVRYQLDGEIEVSAVLHDLTESGLVFVSREDPRSFAPMPSDPIDIDSHALLANSVVLEVSHSGGCGTHDYSLCFDPRTSASSPEQMAIQLVHDAHGDTCNATIRERLEFDLTPIVEYFRVNRQTDRGYISTPYGLFAFGEASCEERTRAVTDQIERAVGRADKSCTTASDCEVVHPVSRCSARCELAVSHAGAAELVSAIERVNAEVCGDFSGDGCAAPDNFPCSAPRAVQCVDGLCQY